MKAFYPGKPPFPLMHIDYQTWNFSGNWSNSVDTTCQKKPSGEWKLLDPHIREEVLL